MSIVNPGGLPRYEDIEANTRKLAEEVILNKSDDGSCDENIPLFFRFFFLHPWCCLGVSKNMGKPPKSSIKK